MPDAPSAATDWTGRPCPKCAYVRTAADRNPAWQCPRCQIAYAKFVAATTGPLRGRVAEHGRALVARAGSDWSVLGLVGANVLALVVALAMRMGLHDLMLVYWMQSVIIGLMNVVRILRLRDFSTEGFKQNGEQVPETPAAKYSTAGFFALHYGFFHFVYFMFIATPDRGQSPIHASALALFLCGLVFFVQHAFSLRHNLESDAAGRPNLGVLMFMPYLRILPMHMTIIFGLGLLGGGKVALVMFGVLKTAADAAMHLVQHHMLSGPFRPFWQEREG